MNTPAHIAILDDEVDIARLPCNHLESRGLRARDRGIDLPVGRLRRKREVDPQNPKVIRSARGAGHILVPAVRSA